MTVHRPAPGDPAAPTAAGAEAPLTDVPRTAAPAPAAGAPAPAADELWRDPALPAAERAAALAARMTPAEKAAQLSGIWVGVDASGGEVAPHQHDLAAAPVDWTERMHLGVGQLTRAFGTVPVDPAAGARAVAATQRRIVAAGRFGIPALLHEECLTGLSAWQAPIYPNPLCWGAAFDPALIERLGAQIGRTMHRLGVHQGLAPVLDVARDLRWGRIEETIGEDPLLVGQTASAYIRGLESAGIVATLKHFVGYSASRSGRNLAPVSIGPREIADVLLPPFEAALRTGVRSVMNAYVDLDGVPVAADPALLTDLLRGELGFAGTVVSDYFSVAFLKALHAVVGTRGGAAGLALAAGIDVELPTVDCYGEPLLAEVAAGRVDEALLDRALLRVLTQKADFGLLDPDWDPLPPALRESQGGEGPVVLDGPEERALAGELARRSIVLLANAPRPDGSPTLPLRPGARLAVVGPRADDPTAMFGCYSFPLHVGRHHPEVALGLDVPTVLDALRADPQQYEVAYAQGCPCSAGTTPASPPPSRPRRAPTCVWPSSATRPACSARAPPARAATPRTCACPAGRRSCWTPCWPPAPRWSPCCWSAGPASCPGRRTGWPPRSAASSRARPAPRPWPTCCPGAATRPAGCRSASPAPEPTSRPPTWPRRWAGATTAAAWTRPRSTPSATACPTPRRPGMRSRSARRIAGPPTGPRSSRSRCATMPGARSAKSSRST